MSSLDMEQALPTFLAESRELLEEMEAALLNVTESPEPSELINAIFRAAHTIKGSAGLFGLDGVVSFTHVLESLLDRVREGELALDDSAAGAEEGRRRLMTAMDMLNDKFGKRTVHLASAGVSVERSAWGVKQERRTPCYTTRWDQVPVARA